MKHFRSLGLFGNHLEVDKIIVVEFWSFPDLLLIRLRRSELLLLLLMHLGSKLSLWRSLLVSKLRLLLWHNLLFGSNICGDFVEKSLSVIEHSSCLWVTKLDVHFLQIFDNLIKEKSDVLCDFIGLKLCNVFFWASNLFDVIFHCFVEVCTG